MNLAFDMSLLAASFLCACPLQTPEPVRADDAPERWTQAELDAATEAIRREIEGLRAQEFERPVVAKLADKAQFMAYAKDRAAQTDTPESLAADESAAKLLGLIAPEMDLLATQLELLEGQVGGFYDPADDTFYLMETFTGDIARIILSHELTHALDDQLWDIDGTLERVGRDTDAELAYHAVVEGSGMQTMTGWIFQHMGEIDMADLAKADMSAGLDDAPQLLWKPLMAVYMQGAAFLEKGRQADEQGFLARAFEAPPRSTEQVLHPDRYWDDAQRDEPRRIEIDGVTAMTGWEVLAGDTLGELMLALITTPLAERGGFDASNPMAAMAVKYTNVAATGWGGDRMLLLAKGDARLLRLVTVWDTPEDAAEFESAARGTLAGLDDGTWKGQVEREVTLGTHPVGEGTAEHVVIDVRLGEGARGAQPPAWREVR